MGRNPWHKYSFSLALILPQILGQNFLRIGIKTKTKHKTTMSSALKWAPAQHPWGPGVSDAPPPPGTTLHQCPKLGEVTRKERSRDNGILWPARGAKSSVAATPAPPQNAPSNLRRSANHRCRGVPAEPRTDPPHHRCAAEWRTGALRQPEVSFGARRLGMTRGGVVGALTGQRGARPDYLSLFPSLPPQQTLSTLTAAAGRGRGGARLAAETEAPAAAEGKPPSPCC